MLTDKEVKQLREDIVFNETLKDIPFVFHTTWGLFSPRNIDEGTLLLLKYLDISANDDCLDLGCGYGPLGLTMAKLAPKPGFRLWLWSTGFNHGKIGSKRKNNTCR